MVGDASRFDLVILGAGPSGVEAASAAALRKMRVALVSDGDFMGYGLEGAFKSKSLYEIARAHHKVLHRWHLADGYTMNFAALRAANSAGAEALRGVYVGQLRTMGVTIIEGRGRFEDPHTIAVGDRKLRSEFIVVATGTRPRVPRGVEPDGTLIMTSDEMVNLDRSLASLLILGSGVIGCEFATIFASLGTRVILVDTQKRIFSHDDADISELLQQSFQSLGVEIKPSARCRGMRVVDGAVHSDLGQGEPVVTDAAVLAVGRVPTTGDLNLEAAKVTLDERGYIPTSDTMQTNVPTIYATGDVGYRDNEHDLSLVHVGQAEGRRAVDHMSGGGAALSTEYAPFIIFTLPMVAGAGLSEANARVRHGDGIRVGKWANVRNHRSHAMQSRQGFVKLIVAPEGDDRVLGARAIGEGVDAVVGQVSVMIQHQLPYTQLLDATQAHPSLAESLQGAARLIAGSAPAYLPGEELTGASW